MPLFDYQPFPAEYIKQTCSEMVRLASLRGRKVYSVFNDTPIVAAPGQSAKHLEQQWRADREER